MNKYVSRGLWTVLVTGGFMALGVGVAHADSGTTGQDGIASGTQGILGLELPVQLGGNAISLLGDASSGGASTTAPPSAGDPAPSGGTNGSDAVAGGTQLLADAGVPIQLGGNAISVLGDASSSGAGTAPSGSGGSDGASSAATDGEGGVLSGSQLVADAGAPVTVGGNAISVLGDASTSDASTASGTTAGSDQEGSTSGDGGTLGGTQLLAGLGAPVTVGGNAVSVLGDADTGGSTTNPGAGTGDPVDPGDADPDPGDGGGAGTQPAALSVQALADTGPEGGMTALALAAMLLAVGGVLVARTVAARRR